MSNDNLPPPPGPFQDFEYTYDPSLSNLFPNPPPLPSSADLFSPAETTDLLGFLDHFGSFNFDFDAPKPEFDSHVPNSLAPYSNPHLQTTPEPSTSTRPKQSTRNASSRTSVHVQEDIIVDSDSHNAMHSLPDSATSTPQLKGNERSALPGPRPKPLLSTPQKRLNHIMSEQKRRNAIRDGYAQLITLLTPAGSAPAIEMPTRGRPKGSGSRNKGQSKGKSGVLFRAVEYCRWLEEGRNALREEVYRLEAAVAAPHKT